MNLKLDRVPSIIWCAGRGWLRITSHGEPSQPIRWGWTQDKARAFPYANRALALGKCERLLSVEPGLVLEVQYADA